MIRTVSAVLAFGMASGQGRRASSGRKKRQPKRSFSIQLSRPLIVAGSRNEVGWPKPPRRKAVSSNANNASGNSTTAARRNNHLRPREISGDGDGWGSAFAPRFGGAG